MVSKRQAGKNPCSYRFSNGSLHEWSDPLLTINETWWVLKRDVALKTDNRAAPGTPLRKLMSFVTHKCKHCVR